MSSQPGSKERSEVIFFKKTLFTYLRERERERERENKQGEQQAEGEEEAGSPLSREPNGGGSIPGP